MEERSPFYTYRYLVTEISEILPLLKKRKELLITDVIEELATVPGTEKIIEGKLYFFHGIQKMDHIYIIQVTRGSNGKTYLGDDDVFEITGSEETFVLIADTKHQIILIEKSHFSPQFTETLVNELTVLFRSQMRSFGYGVNIYPLTSKNKFWNHVKAAEQIYEITLEMNAPNMPFFGNRDIREVLKKIKKVTNNEVTNISIKNKEGQLIISRESLRKYIDYIIEVGGKYQLVFFKNGTKQRITSTTDISITHVIRRGVEGYSNKEMNQISDKLASIHNLENRDDDNTIA